MTSRLWTGGDLPDEVELAATTIRRWREVGIHTVVDVRQEWSDEHLVARVAPEMRYEHLGVDDDGRRPPDWWFEAVTAAAHAGYARSAAVLVHCHMGINRGPSAAYAVLLTEGWNPVAALDHIRTARPIAAVGYAEDALDWWHRQSNATSERRRREQDELARWRASHPHDTVRIIREIRANEVQG